MECYSILASGNQIIVKVLLTWVDRFSVKPLYFPSPFWLHDWVRPLIDRGLNVRNSWPWLSPKIDNGLQFISEEFSSYLEENDTEHRTSTPLWPQANVEIERQNRSLLKALEIAQAERKNWRHELLKFLIAYRSTPHSPTGASPAKLLYEREIPTKIPDVQSGCQRSW